METARAMGWVWSPSGTGHLPSPPGKMIPTQDPPHGAWSPLGPPAKIASHLVWEKEKQKEREDPCRIGAAFPKLM